jgi:phage terminase large subunit GpA-like protein
VADEAAEPRTKATFRPVIIGGNAARDTIRARLALEPPAPGAAPGLHALPGDRDVGYFEQLMADRKVLKEAGGRRYRVWETPAGRANEAADCRSTPTRRCAA